MIQTQDPVQITLLLQQFVDICLGLQQRLSVSVPLRLFSSRGLGLRLRLRLGLRLGLAHWQDLNFHSYIRRFWAQEGCWAINTYNTGEGGRHAWAVNFPLTGSNQAYLMNLLSESIIHISKSIFLFLDSSVGLRDLHFRLILLFLIPGLVANNLILWVDISECGFSTVGCILWHIQQ